MLSFLAPRASTSVLRFFAASNILKRVESVIEERIRPVLKMDGGDIQIHSVDDGVVTCTLIGQCSGCPSRHQPLRYGILATLQEEIPEIKDVREKDEQ